MKIGWKESDTDMAQDYNATLNLPKTAFPMRGNLPKREPDVLGKWEEQDLYEKMVQKNQGRPMYVLHDGPPYANGEIHLGTALNKVLKDFIIKYKNMSGFCAPYVPGWDTHGLPIELKALKSIGVENGAISPVELRKHCKNFAMKHVQNQMKQFKRLGSLGHYCDPYLTLKPEYEARQVEVFGEMAKRGYMYKGLKPVYWCPDCQTALAEAEIEYENDPCDSIYVKFQVMDDKGVFSKLGIDPKQVYFVIWTTTTWTIPGNLAVCVGPDYEYTLVKAGSEYYCMAVELVAPTMKAAGITDYETIGTFMGSELEHIQTKHPLYDRNSMVIVGDHVTLESGTGCVHTAPGYGVEDFEVCKNYDEIGILVCVDAHGKQTAEAGEFEGMDTQQANKAIAAKLVECGAMLATERIVHQYPHCWRCHQPIIYRATEQWFCSVKGFKDDAIRAIRNGVKNASRAWYGIAATGVFPVRELGACQSRLFIVRIARSQSSTTPPSRTLQICSVQKVQMHGGQRMLRTSLTRPLPANAAARNLPKNMTSWMFGLIAAFLTLRLWNSMIACVGRQICIWKVLTSIVAGSSHPC